MTVCSSRTPPCNAQKVKLPPYDSYETLRDKLKYAIEAGCGFELS